MSLNADKQQQRRAREQRGRGENCGEEEEDQAEQPPDLKIARGASVAVSAAATRASDRPFSSNHPKVFQEECGHERHKGKSPPLRRSLPSSGERSASSCLLRRCRYGHSCGKAGLLMCPCAGLSAPPLSCDETADGSTVRPKRAPTPRPGHPRRHTILNSIGSLQCKLAFFCLRPPTHTHTHTSNRCLLFFLALSSTLVLPRSQSGSSLRCCAFSIKEAPACKTHSNLVWFP